MELNKQQQKAAVAETGISLVIAGAGTGKTKTVVEKVKNLLLSGIVEAENILLLTFSRDAANEISDRVKSSGITGDFVTGTFHSFCFKLLREHKDEAVSEFEYDMFPEIIDDEKSKSIFSKIVKSKLHLLNGVPFDAVQGIVNKISKTTDIDKYLNISTVFHDINNLYKKAKVKNNLIDFEDMISLTITLLKNNNIIRTKILQKYKYIIVDEFQDTSDDNFELLKLLMPEDGGNLFAVGDDWQSIYGFRNANVDYILNYKKYFQNSKIYKLKINYRSNSEIVKVSNKFVLLNKNRSRKTLTSFSGNGGEVKFHIVSDYSEEVKVIKEIIRDGSKESALLYRNNKYGESLKNNLSDSNLTYKTFHGSKGLEYEKVIIAGVHDKVIPDRTTDIEEERRLFYVALSRAKRELHVVIYKNKNGSISRFGRELGVLEE